MITTPGLAARLARLHAEATVDLDALVARADELEALLALWRSAPKPLDPRDVVVAAVLVHAWYTALETLLERVARLLDDNVPQGPTWHIELAAQMSVDVPGVRSAVVARSLATDLSELRKFRHFFRNAYVLSFDPVKVHAHATRTVRVHPEVRQGIERLMAHVAAMLNELAR